MLGQLFWLEIASCIVAIDSSGLMSVKAFRLKVASYIIDMDIMG